MSEEAALNLQLSIPLVFPVDPEEKKSMRRESLDSYYFLADLPTNDNTPAGLRRFREINTTLRTVPWPEPYDLTTHRGHHGDARDLSWLPDESVHLVVTSPPYWTLKEYREHPGQLGHVADYESFLDELDKVWKECAIVKNDVEFILFLRKGGQYRKPKPLQKALSMLTKEEMQAWWQPFWSDIRGASTRNGHPAPYPAALAERLIRMFSFAGDTILDPFAGTFATAIAAFRAGRNSICNELDPTYFKLGLENLRDAMREQPLFGSVHGTICNDSARKKKVSSG